MRWFIGIDPGRTGAVVALSEKNDYRRLTYFPETFKDIQPYHYLTQTELYRTGLDLGSIGNLENLAIRTALVFIEQPLLIQGTISARNQQMLHYYSGLIQMWFASHDFNIFAITPDQWKKELCGNSKAPKEDGQKLFRKVFKSQILNMVQKMPGDGEMDAALIALYGKRLWERYKNVRKITSHLGLLTNKKG